MYPVCMAFPWRRHSITFMNIRMTICTHELCRSIVLHIHCLVPHGSHAAQAPLDHNDGGTFVIVLFGIASIHTLTFNIAESVSQVQVTSSIQTVAATVTDVYIAVALSIIFDSKRTGYTGTDSLVTKLVAYALQRGIMTALLQFLQFITLHFSGTQLTWTIVYFPVGKIYTNSLVSMLNMRHWLRETMGDEIELGVSGSSDSSTCSDPPCMPRTAQIPGVKKVLSGGDLHSGRVPRKIRVETEPCGPHHLC
ncbi:uncharacterized protein B0H18DRAFT_458221 [Fomitopsis serialis]|uniref:uncharacterized protein n=1 Tax=Fomitopsis serialis TaxID=139415 RepID=UPI002008A1FA|nr:uncharacterized protein B0H18DRAFT_458221 [Neoantrodia serialis]KAH9923643.1 hypothetical protein B0H18DRAFT_458221 [Neoantrodia serialis]